MRSPPAGERYFLCSTVSRPTLEPTQPPTQWVPGVISPGVKRPGRENQKKKLVWIADSPSNTNNRVSSQNTKTMPIPSLT
jgi:hypothetical protein